jgi:hypothetical protein
MAAIAPTYDKIIDVSAYADVKAAFAAGLAASPVRYIYYFPDSPTAGYTLDGLINFKDKPGLKLIGDGYNSILTVRGLGGIDCDGTRVRVENLRINSEPGDSADYAMVLARNGTTFASVNGSSFRNVWFEGAFNKAHIFNLGQELTDWRHCIFEPQNCRGLVIDSNDRYSLGRSTVNVLNTNSSHYFSNCTFSRFDTASVGTLSNPSVCLLIAGQTTKVTIDHAWGGLTNADFSILVEQYAASASRGNTPFDIVIRRFTNEATQTPQTGPIYTTKGITADDPTTLSSEAATVTITGGGLGGGGFPGTWIT